MQKVSRTHLKRKSNLGNFNKTNFQYVGTFVLRIEPFMKRVTKTTW